MTNNFNTQDVIHLLSSLEHFAIEHSDILKEELYIQNIIDKIHIKYKKNIKLENMKFWKKQKNIIISALYANISNNEEYQDMDDTLYKMIDYFKK